MARSKDVRVEEIELKLERVLQAGSNKKVKRARVKPGLYRTELIEALWKTLSCSSLHKNAAQRIFLQRNIYLVF